jgi:hypothetical protein
MLRCLIREAIPSHIRHSTLSYGNSLGTTVFLPRLSIRTSHSPRPRSFFNRHAWGSESLVAREFHYAITGPPRFIRMSALVQRRRIDTSRIRDLSRRDTGQFLSQNFFPRDLIKIVNLSAYAICGAAAIARHSVRTEAFNPEEKGRAGRRSKGGPQHPGDDPYERYSLETSFSRSPVSLSRGTLDRRRVE